MALDWAHLFQNLFGSLERRTPRGLVLNRLWQVFVFFVLLTCLGQRLFGVSALNAWLQRQRYLTKSLGMLTPNYNVAAIASAAFYGIWNLFSGFLITKPRIAGWWIWYYYLCPVAWTLSYSDVHGRDPVVVFVCNSASWGGQHPPSQSSFSPHLSSQDYIKVWK
jgi:hypothetical protein